MAEDYLHSHNPTAVYLVLDKLTDKGELPEYVAAGNLPDLVKLASITDVGFADSANRQYPIFDAVTTAYSVMDFLGSGEDDSKVEKRIKKACQNFGIADFYDKVDQIFTEEIVKQAAAAKVMVKYAFCTGSGQRRTCLMICSMDGMLLSLLAVDFMNAFNTTVGTQSTRALSDKHKSIQIRLIREDKILVCSQSFQVY